jgi:hypothetical protein
MYLVKLCFNRFISKIVRKLMLGVKGGLGAGFQRVGGGVGYLVVN